MKTSIVAVLLLVATTLVFAHTNLASSVPDDGSQVSSPTNIELEFTAPVRLTAVMLKSADGTEISLGDIPGDTQTSFRIAVNEALAPGHYQVSWRSISGDSHVVSGELRFTVTD